MVSLPLLRENWDGPLALAISLLVGVVHTAAIAALIARLDYPTETFAYVPGGVPGAAVGLVAVLAIPTFVALRYRLVLPLLAAVLGAAWPVYRELTTPSPEFSTLGGHTIISGARHVDAYVDAWYVWLLAYLLVGLAECVVRLDRKWLPRLPRLSRYEQLARWFRSDRRSAARTAGTVAIAHTAVFLLLAADWRYFEPNSYLPSPWYVGLAVLAWTVLGQLAIGGVPAFLLVRRRLVAPTMTLAWLVYQTGWSQNMPLPDDSLPIYFIGWFIFLGFLLAVGGVEYGLRLVGRWWESRQTAM